MALIGYWNETIGADDDVWHLGDFMRDDNIGGADGLLARLNGRKHLIIGNNDSEATIAAAGWSSVQHYAELRMDNTLVVLCHYPFRTWNRMGNGSVNLHGHSHGRLKPVPRQFDVGVDARGFRPATFAEIRKPRRNPAE